MFRLRRLHYIHAVFLVLTIFVLLTPSLTLSAGLPGKIVPCNGTDCTVCDLATLAQNILNTAIYIAVFMAAILFAWAGLIYLTSSVGSSISSARTMFVNVLIGLVIILAGWLIVDTVMKTLVGSGGAFGPWNKIC